MDFDFERHKKEAMENKRRAKADLVKMNAARKGGTKSKSKGKTSVVGTPFPNVATRFDYKRLSIKLLQETAHAAPVARSLWQLQLIAFPWCNFKLIPPNLEELDNEATKDVIPKIENLDRKIRTAVLSAQAMYDVMTYGSAIFEVTWKRDENDWLVPDIVQRLPAESFRIVPTHVSGNTTRYVSGNLLKGIVFDKETGETTYWQVQDSSGLSVAPIQIPTENVIHIRDARSTFVDGEPYLAGITATISQWEFIRQRLMQTVNRVGTPPVKITVGVPQRYLGNDPNAAMQVSALPGSSVTLADDMMDQLWGYAESLAQNVTADAATVVPEGINFDWQRPAVPINIVEYDQYVIREIVGHLFPKDVLEVLGSAISTSAQPLLDLLKIMVQGWQAICSVPFETYLWTEMLRKNGFENYRIELEWAPLITPDKQKEESMVLQKFNLHIITIKEARSALGMETSDEEEQTLKDEYTFYRTAGQQQQGGPGGSGGMSDIFGGMFGGGGTEEGVPEGTLESGTPEEQGESLEDTLANGEELLQQLQSAPDSIVKFQEAFNKLYSNDYNLKWLYSDEGVCQ